MSFFSVPLSGLTAAQEQLQSVSNNLANINTDGYKDQTVSFSDIFFQAGTTNGSGDPLQTGVGTKVASTNGDFTEGNLSPTGIASNMALQGDGFFITQQSDGLNEYTRAGDFTANSSGELVTPGGDLVLGYGAEAGIVSASGPLQPLQVGSSAVAPAAPTTTFNITANLQSSAAVGATASTTFTGYDSLGTPHIFTVQYTKTGSNAWSYNISLPAADTGGPGTSTTVASGNLVFSNTGQLTAPTGTVSGIAVSPLVDGAAPMNMTWNLDDNSGNPTITQVDNPSATSYTSQNGYASGSLLSYAVQPDGTIEGTFSNGKSLALGQVAIAKFANLQGLSRSGNNSFEETAASGLPVVGVAGTGGRGTVVGGSVEQSNVDIAAEFAKMIVAQQAYQANAKSVTTFDQISQTTIAMKT
ncbi:MAG TPA: flagellar hook protein FlgE [Acidisarcina sp.]